MSSVPVCHCSFCHRSSNEVTKMIDGTDCYICDSCIDICYNIIHEVGNTSTKKIVKKPIFSEVLDISPKSIVKHLDQYVIGQEDAKIALAVAVYNHYKRIDTKDDKDDVQLEKSNILMVGPTGSGKTLLAQSIAKLLEVPFAIADATSITEAGYVGDDAESVVQRLLQAAGGDVAKTERGIIYIDEIDKKATKATTGNHSRDISGEGVQQALLKLLEGSEVFISEGNKRVSEPKKINTKNILFIVGGAFVGLDTIIARDAENNRSIGFGAVVDKPDVSEDLLDKVEPRYLKEYGLMPELIGRLPVIVTLKELNDDQLMSVLTEPKNAIVKQYKKLFKMDDVELEFSVEALKKIIKLTKKHKTGARGLRNIIERSLVKIQYELPEMHKKGISKLIIEPEQISEK